MADSLPLRWGHCSVQLQSYQHRPFQATSIPNLFLAGDWVKGVPHGANGLSQERAYVTGGPINFSFIKEMTTSKPFTLFCCSN